MHHIWRQFNGQFDTLPPTLTHLSFGNGFNLPSTFIHPSFGHVFNNQWSISHHRSHLSLLTLLALLPSPPLLLSKGISINTPPISYLHPLDTFNQPASRCSHTLSLLENISMNPSAFSNPNMQVVNVGQRKSTLANLSQRKSTIINVGQRKSTRVKTRVNVSQHTVGL